MQRYKLRNLSLKTELRKMEIIMLSKGIYVLHFCEKVKEFFGSLNETDLCDNKKFWGVVKHLLQNKVVSNEKITLLEDGNIVENDKKHYICFEQVFLERDGNARDFPMKRSQCFTT